MPDVILSPAVISLLVGGFVLLVLQIQFKRASASVDNIPLLEARVLTLEKTTADLHSEAKQTQLEIRSLTERMIRIEVLLNQISASLEKLSHAK